jgi:hypothetical protein
MFESVNFQKQKSQGKLTVRTFSKNQKLGKLTVRTFSKNQKLVELELEIFSKNEISLVKLQLAKKCLTLELT